MNQAQYGKLQALLGSRDYDEALRYLAGLERANPQNPTFPYHRGLVLRLSGDLDGAATEYARALSLSPRLPEARLGLGIVRQLQGKLSQAIHELKTAVELDPTRASAWNRLGLTYKKSGRLREALDAYHRAQEAVTNAAFDKIRDRPGALSEGTGPEGERVLQVGPEYMRLARHELMADTMYSTVMNNIGQLYAEVGDIRQARSALQEAIEFIPEGSDYRDPIDNLAALDDERAAKVPRGATSRAEGAGRFLEDIGRLIAAWGHEVSRSDHELRLPQAELETVVRWVPEATITPDGARMTGRILVLSVLPPGWLPPRGPQLLSIVNMATGLGALTQDARDRVARVASRFTVYEGDEDGWRVGGILLAMSAMTQLHTLSHTMVRLSGGEAGGYHFVSQAPPPDGLEEAFSTTVRILTNAGLHANASKDGLTVEYPWDPGSYSAAARVVGLSEGRTALLTMTVSEANPALGPGLLARLTLPLNPEPEAAYAIADRLNRKELEAKDAPPLFGAWCSPPDSANLVFVAFVPLALVGLQTTSALASWMAARTQQAREWLQG